MSPVDSLIKQIDTDTLTQTNSGKWHDQEDNKSIFTVWQNTACSYHHIQSALNEKQHSQKVMITVHYRKLRQTYLTLNVKNSSHKLFVMSYLVSEP